MKIREWLDHIWTDVRHAVRSLRRSPGFAVVAVLALAVGIGGNTAVFSVVDATRAQAIPYKDPDRLVNLIGNVDRGPSTGSGPAIERRGASYPDFLDWRAQAARSAAQ
jgi:putative ABC transport system permease protein